MNKKKNSFFIRKKIFQFTERNLKTQSLYTKSTINRLILNLKKKTFFFQLKLYNFSIERQYVVGILLILMMCVCVIIHSLPFLFTNVIKVNSRE